MVWLGLEVFGSKDVNVFLGRGVLSSSAEKEQAVLEAVTPEVNSVFWQTG